MCNWLSIHANLTFCTCEFDTSYVVLIFGTHRGAKAAYFATLCINIVNTSYKVLIPRMPNQAFRHRLVRSSMRRGAKVAAFAPLCAQDSPTWSQVGLLCASKFDTLLEVLTPGNNRGAKHAAFAPLYIQDSPIWHQIGLL